MGIFDLFKSSSKSSQQRIAELEFKLKTVSEELTQTQQKVAEMSQLLSIAINAQNQMAMDMNLIYESLKSVAETIHDPAVEDDSRYFKWRWNLDDDDDLPN